MFEFLSTRTHRKDQVAARFCICLFALLFLLCAALSSLPSYGRLTDALSQNGLAGFSEESDPPSQTHEEALKEFTDRPVSEETSISDKTDGDTSAAPPNEAEPTDV